MRVVVDMQGTQRAMAASGGFGDFSLQLAQCLVRTRGDREIVLLASDLHADTIEPIRELFRSALGVDGVRVWYGLAPGEVSPGGPNWRLAADRLIKEAAIQALRPDVLVVPVRVRDGRVDQSAIPLFPASLATLAVLEQPAGAASGPDRRVAALLKEFGFAAAYEEMPGAPAPQAGGRHACIQVPVAQLARATLADLAGADPAVAGPSAVAGLWNAATALLRDRFDATTLAGDGAKPRLAYVSPLPPERSGIADYSAALLPALARYYQIDVIASQAAVSDSWVAEHCPLVSPAAFLRSRTQYQRVLYHFGNSRFHDYMFDLLAAVPGVVVLHDFFLGDIQLIREQDGLAAHAWTRSLYEAHGYRALMERFDEVSWRDAMSRYPANLDVLRQAQGVIVHSGHARRLADDFYGTRLPVEWAVIPLAREPQPDIGRAQARRKLGLAQDEFVVCSVGFINRAKLHDRILSAWSQSALAREPKCRLLFVGGEDEGFGASLRATMQANGVGDRVGITGWVDGATYHDYLAAADLAVQLRMQSRGETSAAVLDCMGHSLATIVNANGSMADLPPDTVCRLPDHFTDLQLIQALESLWRDDDARLALGGRARQLIERHHAPQVCALEYAGAIENFAARAPVSVASVAGAIGAVAGAQAADAELAALALSLVKSVPLPVPSRQLLVDVTAIARTDLKTGIQRVVRALVWEFIQAPPPGYRVEPVYMSSEGNVWHYRYARAWTSAMLGIPTEWAEDDVAEYAAGDVLLIADFTSGYVIEGQRTGMFQALRNAGLRIAFTVYDLLPIRMPGMFPQGAAQTHEAWFAAAASVADVALCISRAVADEVAAQLASLGPQPAKPMRVEWFHLGADLEGSIPTGGLPEGSGEVLAALRARPSFLMVGTVEPRKGHGQVLAGFEALWARGQDVNLVIVGKQGWMVDELCDRLRSHPDAGRRLFWIEGASDEYLQALYGASLCLVAASEGEGFGLPLIEAAQHRLPIIARDIPVFREVAGDHASYFSGDGGEAVADSVATWLARHRAGDAPHSEGMPWLTWRQSARRVLQCLPLEGGAIASPDSAGPQATAADPSISSSRT